MSLLMIFVGWQSFAGTTDSVFVLANNNIKYDAGTLASGDSAIWYIETTPGTWTELTTATTGITFAGAKHETLKIEGANYVPFKQSSLASDSVTIATYKIALQIVSAGGCYSDDSSYFVTQVLPYLKPMAIDWTDSSALCANNSVEKTLVATKPALTGSSSISVGNITWYVDSTTTATQITAATAPAYPQITASGSTSTLKFMTQLSTTAADYHAEATYDLGGHTLILSSTSPLPAGVTNDGHSISANVTIQPTAAPTAPSLSGSSNVSGW